MQWIRAYALSTLVGILAVGLTAGVGCKSDKEETTQAEGKAEGAAKAAEEGAKAAEEAAAGAAKAAEEAAKLAKSVGGTAEGVKAAGEKAVDAAKAAVGGPTSGALSVEVPDDVVVVGGLKSFNDFVNTVNEITDMVAPVPGLRDTVETGLREGMGMKNLDWLDRDRPVKVGVMDPKKHGEAAFLAIPIKDKAAFEGALPETKKADQEGNALMFEAGFTSIYANFVDGYAVLSDSPKTWGAAKGFAEGGLAKFGPPTTIDGSIEVAHLLKSFSAELTEAREELKRTMKMMPDVGASGMDAQVDFLFDLIQSIDRMGYSFKKDGVHALLGFDLLPIPGKVSGSLFKAYEGREVALLDRVPEGSYLVVAANTDPKAGMDFFNSFGRDMAMGQLKEVFKFSDTDIKAFEAIQDEGMKLTTGESLFVIHPEGEVALAMTAFSRVTDGKATRANLHKLMDLLWPKIIEMLKAEAGGDIPPNFDLSTFTKAVQSAGVFLEPQGVKMTVRSEEKSGVMIDALDISVDWAKAGVDGPELDTIKAVAGDKFQAVVAYGKDSYAFTFGAKAEERALAFINGKAGKTPAGIREALKNGRGKSGMLFYASVIDGLKAFQGVPELAEIKASVSASRINNGVGLTCAAGGNDALGCTVDVPLDHIKEVVQILGRFF